MRPNILDEKLQAGETVLGVCVMYPAAGIVEGMCPGWDFVWIDGQHGQMDYSAALHTVRAAAGVGIESMFRVPTHDPGLLGLYADMAPSALMVPMVNTPAQARAVVEAVRFPPLGTRSYGGRRVIDLDGRDFHKERKLVLALQIETVEATDNAEAIAATEGVDLLFFGPDDMRCQLGLPMNTSMLENEKLRGAMAHTAQAARAAGKIAATVAPTAEAIEACLGMGYRMLVCGGDIMFLRTSSVAALKMARETVGCQAPTAAASGGIYG